MDWNRNQICIKLDERNGIYIGKIQKKETEENKVKVG